MVTPASFSAMCSKGDNFPDFLFAYLQDEVFQKRDLLLKERICSEGNKFFSLRVDPNEMGGKNENKRVASPERLCIHLKVYGYTSMFSLPISPRGTTFVTSCLFPG